MIKEAAGRPEYYQRNAKNKRVGDLEKGVLEAESKNQEAIKMATYNEQYSRKTNIKLWMYMKRRLNQNKR